MTLPGDGQGQEHGGGDGHVTHNIRQGGLQNDHIAFCAYYPPLSNHGAFQLFSLLNLFVGEPIIGLQGKGENLPEQNPKGPNITLHGVPGSIRVILDQSLGLENHIRA